MKVDVKMAGNSYSGVPSVLIPLKSGGKARFCEVYDGESLRCGPGQDLL